MRKRILFQSGLLSIIVALLFAGLLFDTSVVVSQTILTPTPDRLAQPTLPVNPSQADRGAQVYWLSCLPCHGDTGQGLTEEFKETYPEEDRNCWKSGCHGNSPYVDGFTLPKNVPAVIGADTLKKFPNAEILNSYIYAAMPYWKPASLTEEETWQVTAFLLRENMLLTDPIILDESNATLILIGAPQATAVPKSVAGDTPWKISPLQIISGIIIFIVILVTLGIFKKR